MDYGSLLLPAQYPQQFNIDHNERRYSSRTKITTHCGANDRRSSDGSALLRESIQPQHCRCNAVALSVEIMKMLVYYFRIRGGSKINLVVLMIKYGVERSNQFSIMNMYSNAL